MSQNIDDLLKMHGKGFEADYWGSVARIATTLGVLAHRSEIDMIGVGMDGDRHLRIWRLDPLNTSFPLRLTAVHRVAEEPRRPCSGITLILEVCAFVPEDSDTWDAIARYQLEIAQDGFNEMPKMRLWREYRIPGDSTEEVDLTLSDHSDRYKPTRVDPMLITRFFADIPPSAPEEFSHAWTPLVGRLSLETLEATVMPHIEFEFRRGYMHGPRRVVDPQEANPATFSQIVEWMFRRWCDTQLHR